MSNTEDDSEITKRIRVISYSMVILNLILFIIWAAFPLLNTIHNVPNSISFWLLFIVSLNGLLPYLLLSALSIPSQIYRTDIHTVVSWALLILNVLCAIAFTIIMLTLTNTTASGSLSFNDPRWDCAFTVICNPSVQISELTIPPELIAHLAFSIIFAVIAMLNLGINRLIRVYGVVYQSKSSLLTGKYLTVLYTAIFLIIYCSWASITLLNTIHIHGYPRFAIPPVPNNFISTRYSISYWALFLLGTNVIPIYLFVALLSTGKDSPLSILYLYSTPIFAIISGLILLFLLIQLGVGCNNALSVGSICNSYKYCHKYFNTNVCGNVSPFPQPTQLLPNDEYIAHIIYSILFICLHSVGLWFHYRIKVYGIF